MSVSLKFSKTPTKTPFLHTSNGPTFPVWPLAMLVYNRFAEEKQFLVAMHNGLGGKQARQGGRCFGFKGCCTCCGIPP